MKYTVDGWNNFCRVFEIPNSFPNKYCFGGGHPVNFQMVDWFNPVEGLGTPGVSKKVWREKVGEIKTVKTTEDELRKDIIEFLMKKRYVKPRREYLVLCDFGAVIRFTG